MAIASLAFIGDAISQWTSHSSGFYGLSAPSSAIFSEH